MRVIEDFVQERRATVCPPGYAAPAADAPFSLEEERRRLSGCNCNRGSAAANWCGPPDCSAGPAIAGGGARRVFRVKGRRH